MKHDLSTSGTLLHSYLFDERTYREKFRSPLHPMSLAEFFRVGKDITIVVGPSDLPEYGCAHFVSSNLDYKPDACFFREGGRWYLHESLYRCG
jgi:hypothetical protein